MKKEKGGLGNMNTADRVKSIPRYCSVKESLEESLKEVKLYREGKVQLQTWDEYIRNKNK